VWECAAAGRRRHSRAPLDPPLIDFSDPAYDTLSWKSRAMRRFSQILIDYKLLQICAALKQIRATTNIVRISTSVLHGKKRRW